ncbi:hypothetical protein BRADI_2g34858v3 [Brachypodium distachyon]|uniref:Uncharacterized protein n=1 Tax=Brachypodium distachyon TaxID=15368 RepID=A0A2K2DBU1_BRADI|nr:hypothetical protein BRADI_2g34858v3 [Brachypodium distachyon]
MQQLYYLKVAGCKMLQTTWSIMLARSFCLLCQMLKLFTCHQLLRPAISTPTVSSKFLHLKYLGIYICGSRSLIHSYDFFLFIS